MSYLRLFAGKQTETGSGIDFHQEGWFDRYITYRKQFPIDLDMPDLSQLGLPPEEMERFQSIHHPLYYMLLHSGLIYGFPFLYPFKPAPESRIANRWITKLVLIDMITFSVLRHFEENKAGPEGYENRLDHAAELIRTYYRGIGGSDSTTEPRTIEHLLADRVTFYRNWLDWRRTGINTHLFWDWYFFLEYLQRTSKGETFSAEDFQELKKRKKQHKLLTMQFIAAAAHSDDQLQRRERVLEHYFEKSSHFFTPEEQERLHQNFQQGVELANIHLPALDWTARRYLLDISMMVVYADKEIHETEELHLQQLLKRLDLTEDDLMESQVALGSFLLRFGRKLPFISGRKSSLALIGRAMSRNFTRMRKATHAEYRETVDMASTFGRLMQHQLGISKNKELPTEEEIAAALDQLKDVPKFLPFFTIVFLPVPGVTEMYILLAYSIERLTGDTIRLLPSNFSKMVKGK